MISARGKSKEGFGKVKKERKNIVGKQEHSAEPGLGQGFVAREMFGL